MPLGIIAKVGNCFLGAAEAVNYGECESRMQEREKAYNRVFFVFRHCCHSIATIAFSFGTVWQVQYMLFPWNNLIQDLSVVGIYRESFVIF